jgi:hypothetical protein
MLFTSPYNSPTRTGLEPPVAAASEGSRPRHMAIMRGRKLQNSDPRGVAHGPEPHQTIDTNCRLAMGDMP